MYESLHNLLHDTLDKVEQISTVEEYYQKFETIRSLISTAEPWLPESYFATRFIYGLQNEFQGFIIRFHPVTVLAAYRLASLYEESIYLEYFPEDEVPVDESIEGINVEDNSVEETVNLCVEKSIENNNVVVSESPLESPGNAPCLNNIADDRSVICLSVAVINFPRVIAEYTPSVDTSMDVHEVENAAPPAKIDPPVIVYQKSICVADNTRKDYCSVVTISHPHKLVNVLLEEDTSNFCWEPGPITEKNNLEVSIAIPMFSRRNLKPWVVQIEEWMFKYRVPIAESRKKTVLSMDSYWDSTILEKKVVTDLSFFDPGIIFLHRLLLYISELDCCAFPRSIYTSIDFVPSSIKYSRFVKMVANLDYMGCQLATHTVTPLYVSDVVTLLHPPEWFALLCDDAPFQQNQLSTLLAFKGGTSNWLPESTLGSYILEPNDIVIILIPINLHSNVMWDCTGEEKAIKGLEICSVRANTEKVVTQKPIRANTDTSGPVSKPILAGDSAANQYFMQYTLRRQHLTNTFRPMVYQFDQAKYVALVWNVDDKHPSYCDFDTIMFHIYITCNYLADGSAKTRIQNARVIVGIKLLPQVGRLSDVTPSVSGLYSAEGQTVSSLQHTCEYKRFRSVWYEVTINSSAVIPFPILVILQGWKPAGQLQTFSAEPSLSSVPFHIKIISAYVNDLHFQYFASEELRSYSRSVLVSLLHVSVYGKCSSAVCTVKDPISDADKFRRQAHKFLSGQIVFVIDPGGQLVDIQKQLSFLGENCHCRVMFTLQKWYMQWVVMIVTDKSRQTLFLHTRSYSIKVGEMKIYVSEDDRGILPAILTVGSICILTAQTSNAMPEIMMAITRVEYLLGFSRSFNVDMPDLQLRVWEPGGTTSDKYACFRRLFWDHFNTLPITLARKGLIVYIGCGLIQFGGSEVAKWWEDKILVTQPLLTAIYQKVGTYACGARLVASSSLFTSTSISSSTAWEWMIAWTLQFVPLFYYSSLRSDSKDLLLCVHTILLIASLYDDPIELSQGTVLYGYKLAAICFPISLWLSSCFREYMSRVSFAMFQYLWCSVPCFVSGSTLMEGWWHLTWSLQHHALAVLRYGGFDFQIYKCGGFEFQIYMYGDILLVVIGNHTWVELLWRIAWAVSSSCIDPSLLLILADKDPLKGKGMSGYK